MNEGRSAGQVWIEEAKIIPADEQVTINASGESGASLEAINRQRSERMQGSKRVVIDTRIGERSARPLLGADAVDYVPRPYESVEFRGGSRHGEVIDQGRMARPYKRN